MMLHVPQVLDAGLLAQVHGLLEAAQWADGRATAGHLSAKVKHNRQLGEDDPLALQAGAIVLDALARHPLFAAAALPTQISVPLFNRYEGGETYGHHVDGAIRPLVKGRLRADLSATLFLSDPASYEGGELLVAVPGGENAVKLAAGDMILYASGARHAVSPVTAGVRLAAVLWIQSLVRGAEQRAMLFELDQTVQRLTAQGADEDAVLGLVGLYHNLLRLWSEP
jgi:PKHD-type hydroxylase